MDWNWMHDENHESGTLTYQESGTLTFGGFSINLPTFKIAHSLMKAIELEIKDAREDEVKTLVRSIKKMCKLE